MDISYLHQLPITTEMVVGLATLLTVALFAIVRVIQNQVNLKKYKRFRRIHMQQLAGVPLSEPDSAFYRRNQHIQWNIKRKMGKIRAAKRRPKLSMKERIRKWIAKIDAKWNPVRLQEQVSLWESKYKKANLDYWECKDKLHQLRIDKESSSNVKPNKQPKNDEPKSVFDKKPPTLGDFV